MLRDTVIFVLWAMANLSTGCGVASFGPADLGAETHDLAEPWDDGFWSGYHGGNGTLVLSKCLVDACPDEYKNSQEVLSNPVR